MNQPAEHRNIRRVALLGGTGFLGRALCRQLSASGQWHVSVVTRDLLRTRMLDGVPGLAFKCADIHNDTTLREAIEGHDAVVNLIAILHGSPAQFRHVHVDLPRRLALACAATGPRRIIHVSALGVDSPRPSNYLKTKAEGEAALRNAELATTILRPSVLFGAEDAFLNTFERMQKLLPFVPLACSDAQFQPVWVEDVAKAIVTCLHEPQTVGRVFECTGLQVLTLRELVRLAGRKGGVERPILALPLALAHVQAWLMERMPGKPLMSRDNLISMQTPNVATDGASSLLDLGIEPFALEDFISHAMSAHGADSHA